MNELEAKCYLTKKGGANNSDHTCTRSQLPNRLSIGDASVRPIIEAKSCEKKIL